MRLEMSKRGKGWCYKGDGYENGERIRKIMS